MKLRNGGLYKCALGGVWQVDAVFWMYTKPKFKSLLIGCAHPSGNVTMSEGWAPYNLPIGVQELHWDIDGTCGNRELRLVSEIEP